MLTNLFRGVFGIALFIVGIVFVFAQVAAAATGLAELWGWNALLASGAAVACIFFLGPVGSVAAAIVGYIGATASWEWEWWQAVLLVAPGLVFVILSWVGGGMITLLRSLFGHRNSYGIAEHSSDRHHSGEFGFTLDSEGIGEDRPVPRRFYKSEITTPFSLSTPPPNIQSPKTTIDLVTNLPGQIEGARALIFCYDMGAYSYCAPEWLAKATNMRIVQCQGIFQRLALTEYLEATDAYGAAIYRLSHKGRPIALQLKELQANGQLY